MEKKITNTMKLTLLVPTYNEEKRIEAFLKELLAYKKKSRDEVEIIIVDNASTDNTQKILKSYEPEIRIIIHERNKGKGASIKTGILASTGDYVVFMDADGSTRLNQLHKMLYALQHFPVVVGSRIDKESVITVPQPFMRKLAGRVFNIIVNFIFPLSFYDCFCGFKGMRAKEGKEIANELISPGWIFDVEIMVRANKKGFGFMVIPIEWGYKIDSKMNLGWTNVKMFFNLLKLRKAINFSLTDKEKMDGEIRSRIDNILEEWRCKNCNHKILLRPTGFIHSSSKESCGSDICYCGCESPEKLEAVK